MMVAVAITAVVMGSAVNVQNVLHEEGDLAYGILFIEGIGTLMLLALLLAIGYVIYLVRHDDAYAARLRRNDVPIACPALPIDDGAPQRSRLRLVVIMQISAVSTF